MRELLKPVVSTALEVAILVKCLPNMKQAAELIEDYARTVASARTREITPEMIAAAQKAIAKHPHFNQSITTAFGFANTALKAAQEPTDDQ